MGIYFFNNILLFDDGMIAMDQACCCRECFCCVGSFSGTRLVISGVIPPDIAFPCKCEDANSGFCMECNNCGCSCIGVRQIDCGVPFGCPSSGFDKSIFYDVFLFQDTDIHPTNCALAISAHMDSGFANNAGQEIFNIVPGVTPCDSITASGSNNSEFEGICDWTGASIAVTGTCSRTQRNCPARGC